MTTTKPRGNPVPLTYKGKTYPSISNFCKSFKQANTAYHSRLNLGDTHEEAIENIERRYLEGNWHKSYKKPLKVIKHELAGKSQPPASSSPRQDFTFGTLTRAEIQALEKAVSIIEQITGVPQNIRFAKLLKVNTNDG